MYIPREPEGTQGIAVIVQQSQLLHFLSVCMRGYKWQHFVKEQISYVVNTVIRWIYMA